MPKPMTDVSSQPASPLVQVTELVATFKAPSGEMVRVLDGASIEVREGEAVGVVGESGSGKTMLCRALVGMLPRLGGQISGGSLRYLGVEYAQAPEEAWKRIRGVTASFVPQSSLIALNPVLDVRSHLREILHTVPSKARMEHRTAELLDMVRLPARVQRLHASELSGGMRQRVMIALALATRPRLLIADEPTTALDVTIQREILDTLARLQSELNLALVFVSHDLAVIEDVCDNIVVLYAGATMETGRTSSILARPRHPYTAALQRSRIDRSPPGGVASTIVGDAPSVGSWPSGCRFRTRCSFHIDACADDPQPSLRDIPGGASACIRVDELDLLLA
jgi:oligopeptide/dipeptide ABC transporter ATP-binding protein